MRRREFDKHSIPKPPLPPPGGLMSSSTLKELEIGAGDGEFAFHRAKTRPDIHFIAIEKSRTLFHRMQRQYQKQKLSNLWIFHTNAVWWITHFVPKNWLDRVYILYPNTYIKARQKNLRWCNRPFMAYLLERIKTGGTLEIRTNQKKYYEETKQKMRSYTNIKESQDLQLIPSQPVSPQGSVLRHPRHIIGLFGLKTLWLGTKFRPIEQGSVLRHPRHIIDLLGLKTLWLGKKFRPIEQGHSLCPPRHGGAFERKYRARGEISWSLVYTKLANPS